jgi:3-methyladenine DNA glycosylase AlkD
MSEQPVVPAIAAHVDQTLRAAGNPARAVAEKRYLKSDLVFLGSGAPAIHTAATAVRKTYPHLDHDAVLALAQTLWSASIHEHRAAAVEVLAVYKGVLQAGDIALAERFLRAARTWALVDSLATGIIAALIVRYPELTVTLDRWVADSDFWVRRAALLALLPPLRQGQGDFARFTRYADALLEDREFFIRKAIGWVLRETAKKQPDLVYAWLLPRATRASGVTIREAVRYLPPAQRDEVMGVYRSLKSARR